jgi:hypothetical protein
MSIRVTPLATLLAASLVASVARAQSLPVIRTADLNKREIVWPRDLTAERTILIVAFAGSQQPAIDRWVDSLGLKRPGAPVWYEVPMIRNPGGIGRWFINSGMRSGIPDTADRAHVVTVYGDKRAMMQQMGLPDEGVHVLIVERGSGRILSRTTGDASTAGMAEVNASLRSTSVRATPPQ